MSHTAREIELSRRLHERLLAKGEPMEIREGEHYVSYLGRGYLYREDKPGRKHDPCDVPLPSWERCQEFLSGRGWSIYHAYECPGPGPRRISLDFQQIDPCRPHIETEGASDLEAILAVCVAVAEEE